MKLSKRLKAICDFVPNNAEIIDVGADHALVDIYLTKNVLKKPNKISKTQMLK